MMHTRLTPAQSAEVAADNRAMLQLSRERRAKFIAERELRAELRNHMWSESAIGELVAAHWTLEARGVL